MWVLPELYTLGVCGKVSILYLVSQVELAARCWQMSLLLPSRRSRNIVVLGTQYELSHSFVTTAVAVMLWDSDLTHRHC